MVKNMNRCRNVNIFSKICEIISLLSCASERSQLKYHIHFEIPPSRKIWTSCLVWRRRMRISRGLKNIRHEEELEEVHLVSLEKRRWRVNILSILASVPGCLPQGEYKWLSKSMVTGRNWGLNWSMGVTVWESLGVHSMRGF